MHATQKLTKFEKSPFEDFEHRLAADRSRLLSHPLFEKIRTSQEMRYFMQGHVFAVWDFMSLLKTLQIQLTCVTVPWTPPSNRDAARLVNEIVTAEESDEVAPGIYTSHFELYLAAMKEAGASTFAIEAFSKSVGGAGKEAAWAVSSPPTHVRAFVEQTLRFCELEPHQVAAAFLFGREDIIPEMFARILAEEGLMQDSRFAKLRLYLERHVELDGGTHGPMARKLMVSLCGNDEKKWNEALLVARDALRARHALWDGIQSGLPSASI